MTDSEIYYPNHIPHRIEQMPDGINRQDVLMGLILIKRREEEMKQTKWISVKERLPVNYQTVIMVNRKDGDVVTGYCHDGDWYAEIYGGVEVDGITHWQPLPEPPTEEPEVKVGM